MQSNDQQDESVIKNIIHRWMSPKDNNKQLRFIICYKKFWIVNLIITNNRAPSKTLCWINVYIIYASPMLMMKKQHNSYIRQAITILSHRLTCHLSNVSAICTHIKHHILKDHNTSSNILKILFENTKMLYCIYFKWKGLSEIIWRFQVQYWLQVNNKEYYSLISVTSFYG